MITLEDALSDASYNLELDLRGMGLMRKQKTYKI
jgi:hypothetical protein